MLVLSRKVGEQIVVPQCELVITVLAVDGKTVRLGFSAPAEVEIFREEVWTRIAGSLDNPPPKNDQKAKGRS